MDDRERRIREREYETWEAVGNPNGRHLEHWRQAEREIATKAHRCDEDEERRDDDRKVNSSSLPRVKRKLSMVRKVLKWLEGSAREAWMGPGTDER